MLQIRLHFTQDLTVAYLNVNVHKSCRRRKNFDYSSKFSDTFGKWSISMTSHWDALQNARKRLRRCRDIKMFYRMQMSIDALHLCKVVKTSDDELTEIQNEERSSKNFIITLRRLQLLKFPKVIWLQKRRGRIGGRIDRNGIWMTRER